MRPSMDLYFIGNGLLVLCNISLIITNSKHFLNSFVSYEHFSFFRLFTSVMKIDMLQNVTDLHESGKLINIHIAFFKINY